MRTRGTRMGGGRRRWEEISVSQRITQIEQNVFIRFIIMIIEEVSFVFYAIFSHHLLRFVHWKVIKIILNVKSFSMLRRIFDATTSCLMFIRAIWMPSLPRSLPLTLSFSLSLSSFTLSNYVFMYDEKLNGKASKEFVASVQQRCVPRDATMKYSCVKCVRNKIESEATVQCWVLVLYVWRHYSNRRSNKNEQNFSVKKAKINFNQQ